MQYPRLKRAIAIAILTYSMFFMVPIILGLLTIIGLELSGIYHLKESLDKQTIFLGGLVFLFVISTTAWKRLVLSRNRLARLLEAEGLDIVEFNGKHIIAEGEGVKVCIDFDRPFMDYNPVPRAHITSENGKQVIKHKGSYDPRYMYRISSMRIEVPRSRGVDLRLALNRRLKSVLPKGVLESLSEDQGSIMIVLKWGSWLGNSVIGLIRPVLQLTANSRAIHR